jgi:hypothetical protein
LFTDEEIRNQFEEEEEEEEKTLQTLKS